jgi:formylmethanofuran dehydrogenase subunit E
MTALKNLLDASAARHTHLCPRQVLGVRIGLVGAAALGLDAPRQDKRLLVIAETDGCYTSGLEAATGCSVGHRTLRVEDYGKIAATFVDVQTRQALRVAPRLDARAHARAYAPEEQRHYFVQLTAYQIMPDDELLSVQAVCLATPVETIVSRAGVRVPCAACGEEIINEREIEVEGTLLCRACAGRAYYRPVTQARPMLVTPSETEEIRV